MRPPRRRIRWCGRRRRASAARYGVDFDTTPIEAALIGGACSRSRNGSEASAERGGVYLIGANFSRARARRSRATRSASRPDPLEPAGRRFANFFFEQFFFEIFRFWGERWSSGVRGPQSDRLAGAACWPPSPVPEFGLGLVRPPRRRIRWCGRRRRASAARYGVDFDTTPIEAALIGGACSRSRNGSEASAERGGVYLIGANFSRARARRSRATRSASRQTRSSRLGGASPISFSSNSFSRYSDSGANDGARAFGARNRTDSLAPPAGRRRQFLSLGWGWCGRRGAGFDGVVGGVGRAQRGTGSTSIPPRSKQH